MDIMIDQRFNSSIGIIKRDYVRIIGWQRQSFNSSIGIIKRGTPKEDAEQDQLCFNSSIGIIKRGGYKADRERTTIVSIPQ